MDTPAAFHPFGTSHLIVLTVTAVLAALMITAAQRRWTIRRLAELLLATLMVSAWPGQVFVAWSSGSLTWENALPLHYCNMATVACIFALWTHRQLACEMAYFFGLAGMLQGLLTPALRAEAPAPEFFFFFFYHVGGVVTALYVILGLRVEPRAGAVWRMFGWSGVYLAIACLFNAALHTNYGFFCSKPPSPSLMDVLGPWPWYVGSLVIVAWIYYSVLNLPFVIKRWRMKELSLPREIA